MMTPATARRSKRRRPAFEPLEGRALLTAGALDTTFGGTGMVTTAVGSNSGAKAVAVQPDLKVVVAGAAPDTTGIAQMTVVRYNADGTLDAGFATGGEAILRLSTISNDGSSGTAVAIQPDGKVVVAGRTGVVGTKKGTFNHDWAIARLNPNGTLDTTFGGGKGYVLTSFGLAATAYPPALELDSIALQPDGRIVAAGQGAIQGSVTRTLVRYNANGSLDATFGSGGVVGFSDMQITNGQMIAIDPTGRIDVAGYSSGATPSTMMVERYLANGTRDSSFGVRGVASVLPTGSSSGAARGVALQSTGQIVVYGNANYDSSHNGVPVLMRLNPDGSLDSTFGTAGFYADARLIWGPVMAIQPDDKIVAMSRPYITTATPFEVTRVLADGSAYDPTFGTNGLAEAFASDNQGGPTSVALSPDGKIVATGAYQNASRTNVFAVARFTGDPLATTTSLASSAASATVGQPVTFTATVSAAYGKPTGSVEFWDGTTFLGVATLSTVNGVTKASFTTSALAAGSHNIRAIYDGDANDRTSTSADLIQVIS